MGGCLLHPELMADVSGAARAHSLQVGGVNHDKVAGCQLFKPGPVPSLLCSARLHQNSTLL